jgi:hypothetical protein
MSDYIVVGIILCGVLILGGMAVLEIREHEAYLESNECVVVSSEPARVEYSPKMGGSFIQIPPKTNYVCRSGITYSR